MSETDSNRDARKLLEAHGFMVERTQAGRGRYNQRLGRSGMADLLIVGRGAGHLEGKAGNGKLRPSQEAWHKMAREHGARVATFWTPKEALAIALEWRREDEEVERVRNEQRVLREIGVE